MASSSDYDVAVIGAGAAGLGAAKGLAKRGKSFVVLEASHRIGGRGYTEEIAPGVPFDLGCHWLHSASINPFTETAEALGFEYSKAGFDRGAYLNGRWASREEMAEWDGFWEAQQEAVAKAVEKGGDVSVYEATDRKHKHTGNYDYIMTLVSSTDVDQISVQDLLAYRDTGENWPLKQGYGNLIAKWAEEVPVSLNSAVTAIDWLGPGVTIETVKGTVRAQKAIITVSTGILAAGDIRFTPELPVAKQAAIAALPVGCHNRIAIAFERDPFGTDVPAGGVVRIGEEEPMGIRIHPFGQPYVVGLTGGRFADWLERAGQEASVNLLGEKLKGIFGNTILKGATSEIVSAWRGDPWTRGAYSTALPGEAHQRAVLAEILDEKLHFAGEATSTDFFSTAHGARMTGEAAAAAV